MDERLQALENRDSGYEDNVHEYIEIVDKRSELDR